MIERILNSNIFNFILRSVGAVIMVYLLRDLSIGTLFLFLVGLLLWTLAVMSDSKELIININKKV